MRSQNQDVGALINAVAAGAPVAQASSATQTGVNTSTGTVIDRNSLPRQYLSCKVVLPYRATVASGKNAVVGLSLQDSSASGSGFANLATKSGGTLKAGSTTTFNGRSVVQLNVNLAGAKRFLRVKSFGSFNSTASGANLTREAPVVIFGGANQNPAEG